MSPAERQARHRAKLASAPSLTAVRPEGRRVRALSRPIRWAAAVETLVELQEEYRAWLDKLPTNLDGSSLADKLQAMAELDLEELQTVDPPRGYGRD
jgi:hypothetical protein